MSSEVKTVRVRIAVAVDPKSKKWVARGWSTVLDQASYDATVATRAKDECPGAPTMFFVEADLPIPETQTIQGEVKEANQ